MHPAARRFIARWGLAALLALALVAQAHRAWGLLTASRILRAVERVSAALLAQGQEAPPLLVHHVELLRRAESLDPANASLALARGSQLMLLRRPEEAREAYLQALALEPRAEVYINLGRALSALGRIPEAQEAERQARLLQPTISLVPRRSRSWRRADS